jgi:hypothetical protein
MFRVSCFKLQVFKNLSQNRHTLRELSSQEPVFCSQDFPVGCLTLIGPLGSWLPLSDWSIRTSRHMQYITSRPSLTGLLTGLRSVIELSQLKGVSHQIFRVVFLSCIDRYRPLMVFNFFCCTFILYFKLKLRRGECKKHAIKKCIAAFSSKFTRNTLFCFLILTKDMPHFCVNLLEVSQCANAATYVTWMKK